MIDRKTLELELNRADFVRTSKDNNRNRLRVRQYITEHYPNIVVDFDNDKKSGHVSIRSIITKEEADKRYQVKKDMDATDAKNAMGRKMKRAESMSLQIGEMITDKEVLNLIELAVGSTGDPVPEAISTKCFTNDETFQYWIRQGRVEYNVGVEKYWLSVCMIEKVYYGCDGEEETSEVVVFNAWVDDLRD